jgi:hypothetical protein
MHFNQWRNLSRTNEFNSYVLNNLKSLKKELENLNWLILLRTTLLLKPICLDLNRNCLESFD